MDFQLLDYAIFVAYALLIVGIALWVSRKGGKTSEDYFLAGKTLPWWAIGASLIAANISAEQFIGMSGSGFALGLAISSYEWMAAITLLIVGKFFLPIFIKKELYTIPEFVEKRYSTNLKTILAVFWIALYVFVNLTTVLFLGAKALDTIMGAGDGSMMITAVIGLAFFAAAYSLWGGLAAVAWTDVV
ncbi:MAG: sodium/glucose cotransporter, partial [Bacteroidota bacterium]